MSSIEIGRTRIVALRGDITAQEVDAIVNAANPTLLGGGGVDGAIHRRGGASIRAACERIRTERFPEGLPTGEAVITTAGALPARFVIHTVGPIWSSGNNGEETLLARAYRSSLAVAAEEGLRTLAFPSISTGAYGFPVERAALIAARAVADFVRENEGFDEVSFVLFSDVDLRVYAAALEAQRRA